MISLFLNLIVSVPVIVLATLLFPALGVLLMILRYAISNSRKDRRGSVLLILIGIILFVPRIILILSENFQFDTSGIPYFTEIINNEFYMVKVCRCAIAITLIGIISLVVSIIFKNLIASFKSLLSGVVSNSIKHGQEKRIEMEKENDLKIKEMEFNAQNSRVISCPNCGASNTIVGGSGKCSFCRQIIG